MLEVSLILIASLTGFSAQADSGLLGSAWLLLQAAGEMLQLSSTPSPLHGIPRHAPQSLSCISSNNIIVKTPLLAAEGFVIQRDSDSERFYDGISYGYTIVPDRMGVLG